MALKDKIGGSTVTISNLIFEELNSIENCKREAEMMKVKVRYIKSRIVMKVKCMDCGT